MPSGSFVKYGVIVKILYIGLTFGTLHAKTERPPYIIMHSVPFHPLSNTFPQGCGKLKYILINI